MTAAVRAVLERYGQRLSLERQGETREIRAFFQPLRERGETVPTAVTALGWTDRRRWLYLGQTELTPEDRVVWRGQAFRVRSCRPCCAGETLSHWRGILERAREEADA